MRSEGQQKKRPSHRAAVGQFLVCGSVVLLVRAGRWNSNTFSNDNLTAISKQESKEKKSNHPFRLLALGRELEEAGESQSRIAALKHRLAQGPKARLRREGLLLAVEHDP